MPLEFDEYADRVTNKSKLDLKIDDVGLIKIAEELLNEKMDELTATLGLKYHKLTDIKAANPNPANQRYSRGQCEANCMQISPQ